MGKISRHIEIKCSARDVFEFHARPENLLKITPSHTRVEILYEEPCITGNFLRLKVTHFNLVSFDWEVVFTEVRGHRILCDAATKSPFVMWRQRREFGDLVDGAVLFDHVEYTLPFGVLGVIADWLVVRWVIKAMFKQRQLATKKLLDKKHYRT